MISWQRCWLVEHVITSNWKHPPWRSGIRPWPKSQGEEVQWHWDRLAEKNKCLHWMVQLTSIIFKVDSSLFDTGRGAADRPKCYRTTYISKNNISKTIWVKVFLTRNAPIPLRCMPSRQGYIPLHYALSSYEDEKDFTKGKTNQGIECLTRSTTSTSYKGLV